MNQLCAECFNIFEIEYSNWIFCRDCNRNKCLRCQIVLTNYKCKGCGKKHGQPSILKDFYCQDCVNPPPKGSPPKNSKDELYLNDSYPRPTVGFEEGSV